MVSPAAQSSTFSLSVAVCQPGAPQSSVLTTGSPLSKRRATPQSTLHIIIRRSTVNLQRCTNGYSPKCVEGEFSVVGIAPFPEHPKPTALLADAKTGTGKSLSYLLPAALSGSRMVISTATKALQHQLVGKDLPPAPCRLPMENQFLRPFCPPLRSI